MRGSGGRKETLRPPSSRRPQAQGDPGPGPLRPLRSRVTALVRDLTVVDGDASSRSSLRPPRAGLARESRERAGGRLAHPRARACSAARSARGRNTPAPVFSKTVKMHRESMEEKKQKNLKTQKTHKKTKKPTRQNTPKTAFSGLMQWSLRNIWKGSQRPENRAAFLTRD